MIVKAANWENVINFRLNPARSPVDCLATAEQIFRKYNPAYPVEYHFADDEYAKKFDSERQTRTLAGLFASLAIFISCLGLFGLSAYLAESRIKEIGVRKVLGASMLSITTLLSKDFLRLVFIAFVIATPIAWLALHSWLLNYSYRIALQAGVFALSGVLAILITLVTISYQAIRAARANPVRSLRTE